MPLPQGPDFTMGAVQRPLQGQAPPVPQFGQPSGYTNPYAQPPQPMDPRLVSAMLGTYGDTLDLDAMEKQKAEAIALRDRPGPEGRSYGGVYTAANPLEHIGHGMQEYAQAKKARELEEGVRNKGYGPGVTATPQPEYSQEGMKQIRARIKEQVRKYGENIPK